MSGLQMKESYLNKIDDRSRKAGFFFPFQEDSFSFSLIKSHFVNQDKYIIRFEKKNEKWKKIKPPSYHSLFFVLLYILLLFFPSLFFVHFFFFLFLFSYTEREREREKPNTFLCLSSLVILFANLFQQYHSRITRLAELGEFKN